MRVQLLANAYLAIARRADVLVTSNPTLRFASVSPCYEPTAE
jgi:hypothetical protein